MQITKLTHILFRNNLMLALLLSALLLAACGGSDPGATPDAAATESFVSTATNELAPARIQTSACEEIPNKAVVKFLYNLEVPFVVSEEQPGGIYCRFESVVVDGPGGDLGRGLAATTLKLWFSFEECKAAAEKAEAAEVSPPLPWTYLSVLPMPNDPDLILSVNAYDGEHCVTVSAPDISSQPLEVWLEFLDAIAGSL